MNAIAPEGESAVRGLVALTRSPLDQAKENSKIVSKVPPEASRTFYQRRNLIVLAMARLSQELYRIFVNLRTTSISV